MYKFFEKILAVAIFFPVFAFISAGIVSAVEPNKDDRNTLYIFSSPTCPHCANAKAFLEKFTDEQNSNLVVRDFELSKNIELATTFFDEYSVPSSHRGFVPAIFVGEKYFIGFGDGIGEEISRYVLNGEEAAPEEEQVASNKNSRIVNLPFIGKVDVMGLSIPVLAITLGIVDGFNVCSLGALVVILGLVMAFRSRKKMFLLGGTFVLTTAIIYGLMIFLWHQFFSFISPYIRSMEMIIGLLALGGGLYLLREFYKAYKSGPICSSNNLLSRITPKLEKVFKGRSNILVLLGSVVMFAAVVTIIEFPCSAFLPVLFTSILVDSGISFGATLFYMSIYMLFYLLDEIIVFLIAVWTLNIKIVSPAWIIFFNLIAAIVFLFLGFYYLLGLTI